MKLINFRLIHSAVPTQYLRNVTCEVIRKIQYSRRKTVQVTIIIIIKFYLFSLKINTT